MSNTETQYGATSNDLLNKILETQIPSTQSETKKEESKKEESVQNSIPSKIVQVSKHIININPVPIYLNPTIEHNDKINKELIVISSYISNNDLYAYGNRSLTQGEDNKKITYDSVTAPVDNILSIKNEYLDLLRTEIFNGVNEFLSCIYNFSGNYSYRILNSYIQKYKNGLYQSQHDSVLRVNISSNKPYLLLRVMYCINNGDPDFDKLYSGQISFTNNNNTFNLKLQTNNLYIWENELMYGMYPFYSKTNMDCTMLHSTILIEF
jgi:hypothetical protein